MGLVNRDTRCEWRVSRGLRLGCRAVVVAAAIGAGCSALPHYPASLPALAEADARLEACPSIAGAFSDSGAAVAPDGRPLGAVSLTRLLHPRSDAFDRASVVRINGPEGDVVEIESFAGERRLAVWRQSKISKEACLARGDRAVAQTYLCQNGFVRLGCQYSVGGGGTPGLVVLSIRSEFLWLRKAMDGSLIALHVNLDIVALNLLLPAGGADRVWYRFAPASPAGLDGREESLRGMQEEAVRP